MGFSLRAEMQFSAGHRLIGYPGKCSAPHGHTYRAELVVAGGELDAVGMVQDFGVLKKAMRGWITEHWDHAFLLNSRDQAMIKAMALVDQSRVYLLDQANPTAENMARIFYDAMRNILGESVSAAVIWETAEQCAEFSGEAR